jgi:hypothetical protein
MERGLFGSSVAGDGSDRKGARKCVVGGIQTKMSFWEASDQAETPKPKGLVWEHLSCKGLEGVAGLLSPPPSMYRAKVPGGWFVMVSVRSISKGTEQPSILYYYDPHYIWDGNSIP